MIVGSLILIFPWYEKSANSIMNTYAVENEVFLSEMRSELMDVTEVTVLNENRLILLKESVQLDEKLYVVEYVFQRKRIIKTYPLLGGLDIKLTRISKVKFKILNEHQISIETQFDNHQKKERLLVHTAK